MKLFATPSARAALALAPLALAACGGAPPEIPLALQPLPFCTEPELRALEERRDARLADWLPWAQRASAGDRAAAWRALARMGRSVEFEGRDAELLALARAEADARVALEIAFALPRTSCRTAETYLLEALRHADGRVRAEAVRGLALLGGSPPWQALLELLHDEHPLARAFAATALLAWVGVRSTAPLEVPPAMKERLVQELLRLASIGEEVPFVRWRALHALAELREPWPDTDLVVAVYSFLQDEVDLVRFQAARLSARLTQHPAAVKALHLLARDPDPRVAEIAAGSLRGKLEGRNFRSIRRSLVSALDGLESRPWNRVSRAAYAALLGDDPLSRHVLRRAMEEDTSPVVRAAAFRGLHRIDPEGLRAERERFLAEESWVLREAAVLALADVGDAELVLRELLARRDDPAAPVRNAAAQVLFEQRARFAEAWLPALRGTLDGGDLGVVGTLAELWVAASEKGAELPLEELAPAWRAARQRIAPAEALELDPLLAKILGEPSLAGEAVPFSSFDLSIFDLETRRRVTLVTTKGELLIELDGRDAPRHTASFLHLVETGALRGLSMHRRVPGFVVQGADPRGDGWGSGGVRLPNEVAPGVYGAGSLGMPDAGLDTGGSQLFFTLHPWPHLEGRYTRFARLLRGGPRVLVELERGDLILDARIEPWPKPPARTPLGMAVRSLPRPLVVAHRGASKQAPENTRAANELAWKLGAHGLETDVRLTKDQRIVCLHDESLKRTTGVDRPVHALSYEELGALDAGAWKDSAYAGERIPLLEEVLAATPRGKAFFLEVKAGEEIVPHLKKVLDASDRRDQVTLIGFDFEVLRQLRASLPDVPILWLVGAPRDARTKSYGPIDPQCARRAAEAGFQGLNVDRRGVDAKLVAAAKAAGQELFVWTVNDPAEAQRLRDLGVTAFTTDVPDLLLPALRQ
ncbi:MAG: HEAT repeat domain-containing protein [Planctomycetes bacterium]|nr:HEAT repeat domain-containing protein [Planctomycetota bacterium]